MHNSRRKNPNRNFCSPKTTPLSFFLGRPTPTVSWFVNERMVEGQLEAIGNHVMVNRLEVNGVTRDHLNSTFKCQASNTKLMMPSEKTVRLELLCMCRYFFTHLMGVPFCGSGAKIIWCNLVYYFPSALNKIYFCVKCDDELKNIHVSANRFFCYHSLIMGLVSQVKKIIRLTGFN